MELVPLGCMKPLKRIVAISLAADCLPACKAVNAGELNGEKFVNPAFSSILGERCYKATPDAMGYIPCRPAANVPKVSD